MPFGRVYTDADAVGVSPSTRARVGVLFRAAHDDALDVPTVEAIEAVLGIGPAGVERPGRATSHLLRYDHARRGHARRVLVQDDALVAVSLRGDWSAEVWLKEFLEGGLPVAALGRLLLKPGSSPPSGFKSLGRVVCNCWKVGEADIVATLDAAVGSPVERLATLQAKLKCGTQCGSCLPELKRMVGETRGMVSA